MTGGRVRISDIFLFHKPGKGHKYEPKKIFFLGCARMNAVCASVGLCADERRMRISRGSDGTKIACNRAKAAFSIAKMKALSN
jgi:hypothetical protein